MNTYEVGLHIGIGDLVCCKSLLMGLKDTSVQFELNNECFAFRGPDYRGFVPQFAKLVYNDPMFTFHETAIGRPRKGWFGLWKEGMRGTPLSLVPNLAQGNSLGKGKYVCLNTKVRGFALGRFMQMKDRFSSVLTALSKRVQVVLMGERDIERVPEYKQVTQVYSIHPMLPRIDAIDLTVPALGITPPQIDKVMQDCKYMSESVATINMGLGGNVPLSTSVSPRCINLIGGNKEYEGMGHDEYEQLLKVMNPGFSNHEVNDYLNALEKIS